MTHFRFLPFCLSFIFFADISAFKFPCSFHNSKPLGNDYEDYAIHDSEDYKWTNNEVPYVFDENTSTKDRQFIREQMDVIQANVPCIKFIEKRKEHFLPNQHLRITVHDKMGCELIMTNSGLKPNISISGGVGNQNSPRIDFISEARLTDCDDEGVRKGVGLFVIHELMHVFGIEHTQKRSDRDDYVNVDESCILDDEEAEYQYEKLENYPNKSFRAKVPYRCDSVMHYEPYQLSKDVENCRIMKSKTNDCVLEGMNKVLPEDWMMLRLHIGCTESAINSSETTTSPNTATSTTATMTPRICPYWNIVHAADCHYYHARIADCNSMWMQQICAAFCFCP